jgi:hypothetical protein
MIATVDGLLRGEGRFAVGRGRVPWSALALVVVAFGFVYGVAMGSFGLRAEQCLYSGLKVPLLLGVTTLVCLPSFFVVNLVLGLADDFSAAFRGVLSAQATIAVVLAALAPVVVFTYASLDDYEVVQLANGVYFAIAAFAGQITLQRHYRPLVARDRRHLAGKRTWLTLYVFVAIQLAWVLRPFIGVPGLPTRFLREEPWSNAYVFVIGRILDVLRRL